MAALILCDIVFWLVFTCDCFCLLVFILVGLFDLERLLTCVAGFVDGFVVCLLFARWFLVCAPDGLTFFVVYLVFGVLWH